MSFSDKVKEEALLASGRHCCICHKFCGTKIEVHHIELLSEGGTNNFDNAIPLCFDCHADMVSYDYKHPKGTKYSKRELKNHRDSWYNKVENNIGTANRTEIIETDKKVYEMLVSTLPWNGSIEFIRVTSFGSSFLTKELNQLYDFLRKCNNPAFQFIDPDLEGMRIKLIETIDSFCTSVNFKTYPHHNPDRNWVPADWEDKNPDLYFETIEMLDNQSNRVCEAYDSLIKTATRKLGIIPDSMI